MPSCVMDLNTNLQKFKNSFDSSKDRLDTKILIQDKKKPFLSPKNLNWTSLKLALNCTCKGCWSVLSLYVWLVIVMFLEKKIVSLNSFEWFEYKKMLVSWNSNSVFVFWNLICSCLQYSLSFVSSRNVP